MPEIRLTLNGAVHEVADLSPNTTLLEYLRGPGHLPGTKEGCAEGDCGACTVALLDTDPSGRPLWRAVNSCLLLLPMMDGRTVWTVEGLAKSGEGKAPHPAQRAMADHLGSQCGYCTPGFVMSLFEATYREDLDAPWKSDDQLSGNLCRCTGYRPIRDALTEVAGQRPDDAFRKALEDGSGSLGATEYAAAGGRFFRPTDFERCFALLAEHDDALLVCGGTDLSLRITKGHEHLPTLVSVEALPGLGELVATDTHLRIGAAVSLSDLEAFCEDRLPAMSRMLRFFGSRQIKHRGTLGGNVCNASPIGDTPPVLLALGATLLLRGPDGERRVGIDDFFLGYRQTALAPGELLVAVELPTPAADARVVSYKVSKRRELDISAVSSCFNVRVDDAGVVTDARLAFGGMAATPARATHAEAALSGQPFGLPALEAAAAALDADFTPMSDHRGSAWYRMTVAKNLLRGFWFETRKGPGSPALPDRPTATVAAGEEVAS